MSADRDSKFDLEFAGVLSTTSWKSMQEIIAEIIRKRRTALRRQLLYQFVALVRRDRKFAEEMVLMPNTAGLNAAAVRYQHFGWVESQLRTEEQEAATHSGDEIKEYRLTEKGRALLSRLTGQNEGSVTEYVSPPLC